MPCESDSDLELHQHVELGMRTQSRGSSREAAAETSAGAPRVLADAHAPAWLRRHRSVLGVCMSCWSSRELVRSRLRVGGVLRCAQSHRARSETRVAVLYFLLSPTFGSPGSVCVNVVLTGVYFLENDPY